MGMRVLGSRKWSRPGRVGVGCDALGGAGALGCAAMRAKGGVAWGGGTCGSQHPTREPGAKQATGRVEHALEGAAGGRGGAEVIARAPGPGVDPPGQNGCGIRCMGAWLARGTREG
eukprot:scaffold26091_cov62-Phaeocystis_antarctica.AAC.6